MHQNKSNAKQLRVYQEETDRTKRVNKYLVEGLSTLYALYIFLISRSLLREILLEAQRRRGDFL